MSLPAPDMKEGVCRTAGASSSVASRRGGATGRSHHNNQRERTCRMTEYRLSRGSHPSPDAGRCAMEWVSYLAGEPHSDQPVCVSPLLRQFCISLNDTLPDEKRQAMRPYLARTIGTAGDGKDPERSMLAVDWLIRVYAPSWLDLVPSLAADAAALRALPPVLQMEAVDRAMTVITPAKQRAAAAWDAAWDAARAAAGAAAGDAAGAAAGDAAGAAAWAAAGAAAGDAARAAAGAAAWDAARDAGWAAAGAAAWDAARDAGWAAARDVLSPTVEKLQHSAVHDLLASMLPTELVQIPAVGVVEAERVCGVPVA